MNDYMTIGKVAGLINVNPRTLRFYEQIELFYPSGRSATGYRLYSPQDVEKLRFIIRAKEFGLTLEEIKSVLSLTDDRLCRAVKRQVAELLSRKISEIDIRIRELESLKEEFSNFRIILENNESRPKTSLPCNCLE